MRWKKWIHDPTKNFKKLHHKELAKVPSAWEGLGRNILGIRMTNYGKQTSESQELQRYTHTIKQY